MDDLKIELVPGEPLFTFTRTLHAPRTLVWRTLSEAEHMVRWFGPGKHSNRVLEFDFRVGGKWRVESTLDTGEVLNFFGEFREIAEPETITQTFAFDGVPEGMHSVDTVVLEDHGDVTVYRARSVLPDMAALEGMLGSGMEAGMREGFERLDELLVQLAQ